MPSITKSATNHTQKNKQRNKKIPQSQPPPIIITTTPLPLDHTPASWLELALQGQGLTDNFFLGNQLVTLIIQNPSLLARVTMEAMNRGLTNFGTQLWQ